MINFIEKMELISSYKIYFISDSAATLDFGNFIDEEINKKVITLCGHLSVYPLFGMVEALPAYSSLTVYFDIGLLRKGIPPQKKIHEWIKNEMNKLARMDLEQVSLKINLVRIPVCYDPEFAPDMEWISQQKNIEPQQIIQLHSSREYRVYMLGFLPGFAYMGEVDEQVAVPRKAQPQATAMGSVGIAGKQTGIYPFNSPGGWQIIGRTPLKIFDKNRQQPCLLKAGNYVEFYSISKDEFENY